MDNVGWIFANEDGVDAFGINYRASLGEEISLSQRDLARKRGFRVGKSIRGAGERFVPGSVFRCSYSSEDVLEEDKFVAKVSRLLVLEEVPAWKGYGPRGRQAQKFVDSLGDIAWLAHVGEPFRKPSWAKKMAIIGSWGDILDFSEFSDAFLEASQRAALEVVGDAALHYLMDAAGYEAWNAAWEAVSFLPDAVARRVARNASECVAGRVAEIIGGVEGGLFSHLMEIYAKGHYPCFWDGDMLVVF